MNNNKLNSFNKMLAEMEMRAAVAELDARLQAFGEYLDREYGEGTSDARLGEHPTCERFLEVFDGECQKASPDFAEMKRLTELFGKFGRSPISRHSTAELAAEILRREKAGR